jgi:hypothetical protein
MKHIKLVACVLAASLLMAGSVFAATVTLNWDDTENLPADIQGYRIYYDTTSHANFLGPIDDETAAPYAVRIEIADPNARTYVIPIRPGTYTGRDSGRDLTAYLRIVSYGSVDGIPLSSAFSEEFIAILGVLDPSN